MTYTVTSTSVVINWLEIDCIERNGVITDYTVVFQEQGGAVIPGEVNVMDRTFTTSGLTPHTNYIFRVAGVNSNGTGPYSNDIIALTDEDGKIYIYCTIIIQNLMTIYESFLVCSSWRCVRPHWSAQVHLHSAHLECPSRT